MTLTGTRNGITLLIFGLYLILNRGFMLVRFPPGTSTGVPVGEIWLLFLLFMFLDYRWLTRFANSLFLLPFVLWWTFGIGSALYAVPQYGLWAMRDATHVIESLYLWVGFVFAANPHTIERLFVWLRRLLIVGVFYAFTFPFREGLREITPTIQAATGYPASLFINYITSPVLLLLETARRTIWTKVGGRSGPLLIPGFLVFYAVSLFQARTIYLQVIAILLLLGWQRRAAFGRMGLAMSVAALVFVALIASGIEILGRKDQVISIDFFVNHFAAIWGRSAPGVEGPAFGVSQRFDWWAIIWRQLTDDPVKLFFGLGYGHPLIDFLGSGGMIVREPHNSYMSILGRMGLFGVAIFTWGHVLLLQAWFRAYGLCRRAGLREGQNRLLLLMVYFVLIWVQSLGEDAFEKPYFTIPYYFFWGIVVHYGQHLKRQLAGTRIAASTSPRWHPGHNHARPPGT